jgi:hypothetical protein
MLKSCSMSANLLNFPVVLFVISVLVLWLAAWVGSRVRLRRSAELPEDAREDFSVLLAASLTLLGLIIGFSFSMATGRYDQRKNLEEEEANAIGTEYLRADLLPPSDASQIRALLRQYTDLRLQFYRTRWASQLKPINDQTSALQNQLWAAVSGPANAQPTPVRALAVAGMNDVINSQGYTQAAWWNRIPHAAWGLMAFIAIFCNLLFGYGAHRKDARLFVVLPIVVAISFLLIADIDSPRGGLIHVRPLNLESLSNSLNSH